MSLSTVISTTCGMLLDRATVVVGLSGMTVEEANLFSRPTEVPTSLGFRVGGFTAAIFGGDVGRDSPTLAAPLCCRSEDAIPPIFWRRLLMVSPVAIAAPMRATSMTNGRLVRFTNCLLRRWLVRLSADVLVGLVVFKNTPVVYIAGIKAHAY